MKVLSVLIFGILASGSVLADGSHYSFRSSDSWHSNCYSADASGAVVSGSQPVQSNSCTHSFGFVWNANVSQALCYAVDEFGYAANRANDTVYDNIYCINFAAFHTSPILN